MKILTLDTENSTFQYGNPFARRNRCCIIPYLFCYNDDRKLGFIPWEYSGPVSCDYIRVLTELIKDPDLIVGFNLKYDLHWLRRYGILEYSSLDKVLWDCQLAQFIIRNQSEKMPSLDSSCEFWGIGKKLDIVKTQYWEKGIDTPDIPLDILSEYGMHDVDLTYNLYLKQIEYLKDKPKLAKLIRLVNQDMLVLAEMEWNGLRYDVETSNQRATTVDAEILEIDANLKRILGPYNFNFNSGDQLSSILFGGTIRFDQPEPYEHVWKTGPRAGLTETRLRHNWVEVKFPRLCEPDDKNKLKKEGFWSCDESALKQLKVRGDTKAIVTALLKRSALERLVSTYYRGFPKKMKAMDWQEGEIHSNLNQTVAITGRLSSSNPNQQNIPPSVYELVKTRY